jgi:hypothetical protein
MIRTKPRGQGGAPRRDREDRKKGSGSGSPLVEELAGELADMAEIRRGIASIRRRILQGKEKGSGEERPGYL